MLPCNTLRCIDVKIFLSYCEAANHRKVAYLPECGIPAACVSGSAKWFPHRIKFQFLRNEWYFGMLPVEMGYAEDGTWEKQTSRTHSFATEAKGKISVYSIFQGKWFEVNWSEINEILRTLVRCLMYSREIKSIEMVCICHSMLKRFFCLYSLLVFQRWHILFPNDQPPDASFNYICSRIEALFYDVDFPRLQNRNSLWGVKSVVNFPNRGGRAYITADIEYEGIYS